MLISDILKKIDGDIISEIKEGKEWEFIKSTIRGKINKYKKMKHYIPVSEKYLINNWSYMDFKKKVTTMFVIQNLRRLNDIDWIIKNNHNFSSYDCLKMYNLILMKDKLKYNQSISSSESEISSTNSSSNSNS